MPRSIPAGFVYADFDNDGKMDLQVVNNSQPTVLSLNKANGTWQNVAAVAASNPAWFSYFLAGTPLKASNGITENFVRIGHSLFALLVGWLGGQLSRRLCRSSSESGVSTLVNPELTNT